MRTGIDLLQLDITINHSHLDDLCGSQIIHLNLPCRAHASLSSNGSHVFHRIHATNFTRFNNFYFFFTCKLLECMTCMYVCMWWGDVAKWFLVAVWKGSQWLPCCQPDKWAQLLSPGTPLAQERVSDLWAWRDPPGLRRRRNMVVITCVVTALAVELTLYMFYCPI